MSELVELDNTIKMSPEQVIARAGRDKFKMVAVIGVSEDGTFITLVSDSTDAELYWLLSVIRQDVLTGNLDDE